MLLDPHRLVGEAENVLIADAVALALLLVRRDVACLPVRAASGVDHLDLLAAEGAPQNGSVAAPEGRLEDVEFVGIDRSLHHVFTKTVGAGDEHDVAKAGLGVDGENHSRGREIGPHHLHDADRVEDLEMVEAPVDAGSGWHGR